MSHTRKIILAHFYDPTIPQICFAMHVQFTVLELRQYLITTYNLPTTAQQIELWISPNSDKSTVSQHDNHKLLFKLFKRVASYNYHWIYWFNKTDFLNKFQKWVFWSNVKHFAKCYKCNVSNPIAISFKDLVRCHRTVAYQTPYIIPATNGVFDSKYTLNQMYQKMIEFNQTETMHCNIYGNKFKYSKDVNNIYFHFAFNDKHIVVEDNYHRSLHAIITDEAAEEKKIYNDSNNNDIYNVVNVEIYWLDASVVRNTFYATSKLQFAAIHKHLLYDLKRKYVYMSILLPCNASIRRSEYGALFELSDVLTIKIIKQCIDKSCEWSVRNRIYYIVQSCHDVTIDVILLSDVNDNDLISKYIIKTDVGYKVSIRCMNSNRLFYYDQLEEDFDAIYANIDKTELGNKIYFKVEVNNIKTKHTYCCGTGLNIWRGRFVMIDNMTVADIKQHIVCSIYVTQQERDELNLGTSVIFCEGKLLKDDDLICNVKKVENDQYWSLDVLFILKGFYSNVIVPQSYLACIRYSQYVLTSIICLLYNNALLSWPGDLSVVISFYLYGDKAWPITNVLKEKCTLPVGVEDNVESDRSHRTIEIYPYETVSDLKNKMVAALKENRYYAYNFAYDNSNCIRLCKNNEKLNAKTIYEAGLFNDNIECYFSEKKRVHPLCVDDEHLVYLSKTYSIRYKNVAYKSYFIGIDCFINDTIDNVKRIRKISHATRIDVDKIRFRDADNIEAPHITTDEQMQYHIERGSKLEQY